MIYVDTSLIVTAITREPSTAEAQQWLRDQLPGELCVSWWSNTEVLSALAQKLRASELIAKQRLEAEKYWRALMNAWRVLPVGRDHFAQAADLTLHGLRAADALHLAIARDAGAGLATRDRMLAGIAARVGLETERLP